MEVELLVVGAAACVAAADAAVADVADMEGAVAVGVAVGGPRLVVVDECWGCGRLLGRGAVGRLTAGRDPTFCLLVLETYLYTCNVQ